MYAIKGKNQRWAQRFWICLAFLDRMRAEMVQVASVSARGSFQTDQWQASGNPSTMEHSFQTAKQPWSACCSSDAS